MSKRRRGTADPEFKVIVVGDSGAGKSCLLQRYLKGNFSPEHLVTIGKEKGNLRYAFLDTGAEFESKQI
jgi:GTPase SAR1 family protein